MAYMTFEEQYRAHLKFLRSQELDIEALEIEAGLVRSRAFNQSTKQGKFCYATKMRHLEKGLTGLITWCRGLHGETVFKTYGTPAEKNFFLSLSYSFENRDYGSQNSPALGVQRARLFWSYSDRQGVSDYLIRKQVGCYGVRFRKNNYGRVAVVPMRNLSGELQNCQILNPNGEKRFLKGRCNDLFHQLKEAKNGFPIGLCESYVTAATCYELLGISMFTAFLCGNIRPLALRLKERFPKSRLIIFADNDRHLPTNKGMAAALSAQLAVGSSCIVSAPDFGRDPRTHEFTDWNDLLRVRGYKVAREMLIQTVKGQFPDQNKENKNDRSTTAR